MADSPEAMALTKETIKPAMNMEISPGEEVRDIMKLPEMFS